jgi:hypothetical protein
MKIRPFAYLLLPIAIPAVAFWGGMFWRMHSQEAKAEHQALWMARTWSEGIPMENLCHEAGEAGKIAILREEWDAGNNGDIVLGPVVSGRRVCVRRDRAIYWRDAK